MDFGYKRVSTLDQITDRQLEGIKIDRVFEDKLTKLKNNQGQTALDMMINGI